MACLALAQSASKYEKILAQQENLVVLVYQTRLFSALFCIKHT